MGRTSRLHHFFHLRNLLLPAILLVCPVPGVTAAGGELTQPGGQRPVLRTDRTSCVAGEPVTILGSGFAPFESVTLRAIHADGSAEPGMGHEPWTIPAGADGTFKGTWSINSYDSAGLDFLITADGSAGSRAQTSFTRVGVVAIESSLYESWQAAQIKAAGFSPGELVNIQVTPVNEVPVDPGLESFTTVSDANGRISTFSGAPAEYPASLFRKLMVEGVSSNVQALALTPSSFSTVTDQHGANDEPGQKDLTLMGRDDSDPDFLKIFWNWDDVDFTAQAGDACALLDSNENGNIDLAICGEVVNGPGYSTTNRVIVLSSLSLWSCGDSRSDRCAQPTSQIVSVGRTNAGILGSGNPLDASGNLVTASDPFPQGDFSPLDTTLQVNIDRSFLNAGYPGAALVNVCSYPSIGSGGNTDPSDCIMTPGGGYLVILKDAGADAATSFTFTVNPVPAGQPGTFTVLGSGSTETIGLGTGSSVAVSETVPEGWMLQNASCVMQDGSPTGMPGPDGVTGISIQSGLVTLCQFANVPETPKLILAKSASPASYDHVGQLITYTYVLENVGNVTLGGPFTVTDNKATVSCPAAGSLGPNDTLTCTASYAITQADLDSGWVTNTAMGHARFDGASIDSNQAAATVNAVANPALELTKSAKPETYSKAGDVINYEYTLKNTSNVTLSGPFTVSDDKASVQCTSASNLAPNDTLACTASYAIAQQDLDAGSVTNIAVGHATSGGKTINSNQAQATVIAAQSAVLSLTKNADPATYSRPGDVIGYTYVLKNTGNLTLSGPFTVTDDKAAVTCPATGSLAPGDSVTCAASYRVSQADINTGAITNRATGQGTIGGKRVASNTAQATVNAVQSLVLSLTKSASPTSYSKVAETIDYTYVLKNSGNVTLSGPFTVTDDKLAVTCPSTPASLAPDDTLTCTGVYKIAQADLDKGSLTNHATASAMFGPSAVNSNQAVATISGVQGQGIAIDKSPEAQTVGENGTAAFTITVTNTGNVTLKDVTVSDPLAPNCGKSIGTLQPGASHSYACTAVAAETYTNVATVTGRPPTGPNISASDTAVVLVASDLTLTVTTNPGLTRTFSWNISKSVDRTSADLSAGSAVFNYSVNVGQTGYTDSDWVVNGKIMLANPNSFPIAGVNISNGAGGGASCSVTGGSDVTVPAGGSVQLNYACTLPGSSSGTHTVTASWNKDTHRTPTGQVSASAGYDFSNSAAGRVVHVNDKVTVTDSFDGKTTTLGTVTATLAQPYAPMTFTYTKSIPAASGCLDYVNTARIVQTGQTATQTVKVCGASSSKSGALSKGFWQNKNGQGIIRNYCGGTNGTSLYDFLRRYAPFQDLTATDCAGTAQYVYGVIKAANSKGPAMNAMLKAQMLATALDVYFSDPALGGNRIKAPAPVGSFLVDLTRICGKIESAGETKNCGRDEFNVGSAFGGANRMTVSEMVVYAASQSNPGGSLWYGNVKSVQGLAKNAFDAINNDVAPAP